MKEKNTMITYLFDYQTLQDILNIITMSLQRPNTNNDYIIVKDLNNQIFVEN